MSTIRFTARGFRLVVAFGLMLAPTVMRGQSTNKSVSVRFILSENFSSQGFSAVVQQTGGPKSEYIIAVRREYLNVETIAQCLNSLKRVIEQVDGNSEIRSVVKIAESAQLSPANNDNEAKVLLNRLRAAARKKVPRITGDVQTFEANVKLRADH